ncbi:MULTISPECIES: hypothetical protein [Pseudomonas]|uniref:hypothetical protein n=1 Tax=Pseudomonas TaxID=286 RepID=UPI000A5469A0|nr:MULTISPECIES: hypothetical protein [Pseudomonas]AZC17000.1 hypothetical protein C4K40_1592 [Pseudomonas sp. CMR5c]
MGKGEEADLEVCHWQAWSLGLDAVLVNCIGLKEVVAIKDRFQDSGEIYRAWIFD